IWPACLLGFASPVSGCATRRWPGAFPVSKVVASCCSTPRRLSRRWPNAPPSSGRRPVLRKAAPTPAAPLLHPPLQDGIKKATSDRVRRWLADLLENGDRATSTERQTAAARSAGKEAGR